MESIKELTLDEFFVFRSAVDITDRPPHSEHFRQNVGTTRVWKNQRNVLQLRNILHLESWKRRLPRPYRNHQADPIFNHLF